MPWRRERLSSVQLLSRVWLLETPWTCNKPGPPVHHQLPEFTQTHPHWVGDAIQSSHPLSSPSPPAPSPPSNRVFTNESTLCMRCPKYWTFSFSISPSNEHPGLISFRMDWLDLLAVQGTLKSLLQHHSSKASILRYSAFFTVQLSHPYMTPGKTIALTRRTFVGKVMSLLFNMLSRLVITFLPRRSAPAATDSAGTWPWGATPRPRSGVATESVRLRRHRSGGERSLPTSQVRGGGREELPHAQGQGRRPRGATPPPRSGCCGARERREDLLHVQGQKGRPWEDTPRPRQAAASALRWRDRPRPR